MRPLYRADRDTISHTLDRQISAEVVRLRGTGLSLGEAIREALSKPPPIVSAEEPRGQQAPVDDDEFLKVLRRWAVATLRFETGLGQFEGIPLDELLDLVTKYDADDDFAEWCQRRFPKTG